MPQSPKPKDGSASEEQPSTPPKFSFDKKKLEDKIANVEAYYKSFAGKTGYNPFFYLHKTVAPLKTRLASGEQSEELHGLIMSLINKEPLAPGCSPLVGVNK